MRAGDMNDADIKGLMCRVAESYEKIAIVHDKLAELTQHRS
jgi:hypothetical protein